MSSFWKRSLALFLIGWIACSNGIAQQRALPSELLIRKHTTLRFSTLVPLDSRTAKVGDDVQLKLQDPLIAEGFSLLEAGQIVHARVLAVRQPGRHGRDGDVRIELKGIPLRDGSNAPAQFWFSIAGTQEIPKQYYRDSNPDGLTAGETAGLIAIGVLLLPILVVEGIHEHFTAPPGGPFTLPENSTVAVWFTKDHAVRLQPDDRYIGAPPLLTRPKAQQKKDQKCPELDTSHS